MTYKILSKTQYSESLNLSVEYTFDDNSTLVTDVAIFAPSTVEDVNQSIINRGLTEQTRMNMANQVASIIPQIEVGVTVEVQ